MSLEKLHLEILELLEQAEIPATVSQARSLTSLLDKRFEIVNPPKKRAPWAKWTPKEIQVLRSMYERGDSKAEIVQVLGRSRSQIAGQISRYGLLRPTHQDKNV